jgi:uncharacterized membrane protein YbhN (UPF0104 family)
VAVPDSAVPEFTLPGLDLRVVARRAALPAALAVAAIAALLLAGGPLGVLTDALNRALAADPRWIGVAAIAEILSFTGYVALLWLVGHRATRRLDLRASAEVTLAGAAATRLLPTGGAGGAALTLWAIGRSGLGVRRAGHVLLTFLVLVYAVFLAGIAVSGAAIALGLAGDTGNAAVAAVAGGLAATGMVTAVGLALRAPAGTGRIARAGGALGGAVRTAVGLLRSADPRLLGAPAWWIFDGMVLWATFHTLGEPPALAILAFAYLAGQVGNTLPIPGAVSGGMVGTLLAFGVEADLALSSVLAYRAIAIWLPAPVGLVALGALRARIARWAREDAAPAPAPAAPVLTVIPPVRTARLSRADLLPRRTADCAAC